MSLSTAETLPKKCIVGSEGSTDSPTLTSVNHTSSLTAPSWTSIYGDLLVPSRNVNCIAIQLMSREREASSKAFAVLVFISLVIIQFDNKVETIFFPNQTRSITKL